MKKKLTSANVIESMAICKRHGHTLCSKSGKLIRGFEIRIKLRATIYQKRQQPKLEYE